MAAMPPKVPGAWPEAIAQMMFVEMIQKPLPTPAVKEEPVQEEDEEARSVLNELQAPEEKEEEEDEDAMSVLNEQQAPDDEQHQLPLLRNLVDGCAASPAGKSKRRARRGKNQKTTKKQRIAARGNTTSCVFEVAAAPLRATSVA